MSLARTADRLHQQLRSNGFLQHFTLFCRTTLALAFVSPGLTKVLGHPFANPVDPVTPIGELPAMAAFFEAFHSTGVYYSFVGAAQVAAALLLLSRRTALLGAVLYFPVIANICVLTVATHFGPLLGTQLLTVLMVLACLWLLVWDAHRLAPLFSRAASPLPERVQEPALWDLAVPASAQTIARGVLRSAFLLGFAATMAFMLAIRGHFGASAQALILPLFFAALASVPLALLGWARWWWTDARSDAARSEASRSASA